MCAFRLLCAVPPLQLDFKTYANGQLQGRVACFLEVDHNMAKLAQPHYVECTVVSPEAYPPHLMPHALHLSLYSPARAAHASQSLPNASPCCPCCGWWILGGKYRHARFHAYRDTHRRIEHMARYVLFKLSSRQPSLS